MGNSKYENILDILEEMSIKNSDKIVFEDENVSVNYKTFVEKSRALGMGLLKYFEIESPVAIFMEKSVLTLEVMFGAVYAGCFYSIIDVHHPLKRITDILETLKTDVMVTTLEYVEILNKLGYKGKIILVEEIASGVVIDNDRLQNIRKRQKGRFPLYCNFTSGSTGVPKGVLVGHESVIDFISNFINIFEISSNDIIGNQAPFDFDVSVKDIYSTIFAGAKMVIIPKRKFSFPMELIDYLCEREVTTLIWAVSALCIISTLNGFTYKVMDKVNKVIFSGEVMPVKHLNVWRHYIPDAVYANVYGPTEITCNCTYYKIDKNEFKDNAEKIPIGKAFPNEDVFLLNEKDELISKAGVSGEICVSGKCLALGYYNNDEQTKRVFVKSAKNCEKLMYRTGDLASYDDEENLVYIGRKDFQIKHMGHRIELGEIELAMESIENVDRACVIFNQEMNCIAAFYSGDIEKREIKKELRESLPVFMIPTKFQSIEKFPLNKNGKIDRKELMEHLEDKRKKKAVDISSLTPAFIFDEDILDSHVKAVADNLRENGKICYAMKANPFLIGILKDKVPFFEVCSPGELKICKRSGILAEKIVLSGVFKEESDIEYAINEYGVTTFTIESYNQYKLLDRLTEKSNKVIKALIRITSGNQFGMDEDVMYKILSECKLKNNIKIEGIQLYSGTQKRKTELIEKEIMYLSELMDNAEKVYGSRLSKMEYGPGIFVPYFINDVDNSKELVDTLIKTLEYVNHEKKREIILEMGRYIAAGCGTYVSKVVDIKENKGQKYCIIDGGINHLNYYGQTMSMKMMKYKHMRNGIRINNDTSNDGNIHKYTICGSLCTVADVIVKNMELKDVQLNDIIVFENVGAYSVTEGIYMFLSRDMPVIAINSKKNGLRILREKYETNKLNGPE